MKTAEFNKSLPSIKEDIKGLLKRGFKANIYETEVSFYKGMSGVSFDMGCGYTVKQLKKIGDFVKSLKK